MLFYRAQRLYPQSAEFRLGAEKSFQTISALLFKPDLFGEVEQLLLAHQQEEEEEREVRSRERRHSRVVSQLNTTCQTSTIGDWMGAKKVTLF